MNGKYLLFFAIIFSSLSVSAQKTIKAKDAIRHVGENVFVIGKIVSAAGPGFSTSISFYLTTDSTEIGIGITVPFEIWSKYEKGDKLLGGDIKGKTMKVYGVVELYGEPLIRVKNAKDISLINTVQ